MSAESLAVDLAAVLAAGLPQVVLNIDAAAGAGTTDLSNLEVHPHQVGPLTVFPAVEIVVRNGSVVGRDDRDGESLLLVQYGVRIYFTVRGGSYLDTDRARKRLVQAGRELLLNGALAAEPVVSSLRTSYSEIDRDNKSRTYGAGYVEATLSVLELAETPPANPPTDGVPVHVHVIVDHLDQTGDGQ